MIEIKNEIKKKGKKMKRLNKLVLTLFLLSFALTSVNAAEVDCNNPKGFHQKMVCKMKSKLDKSNDVTSSTEEKKTIEGGFFKKLKHKIKTFGGKNIGSEG